VQGSEAQCERAVPRTGHQGGPLPEQDHVDAREPRAQARLTFHLGILAPLHGGTSLQGPWMCVCVCLTEPMLTNSFINPGFCHTEIVIPDLECTTLGSPSYLSSSIYNGETVTLTRTKTFANPGYTVLTFTVDGNELSRIGDYLHESKRMQLGFDYLGMYLAALPFQVGSVGGMHAGESNCCSCPSDDSFSGEPVCIEQVHLLQQARDECAQGSRHRGRQGSEREHSHPQQALPRSPRPAAE